VRGDVDELRAERHITDGEYVRIARAQVLVDDDLTPRTGSHACEVQP
jgi:hypothetical protein